MLFRSKVVRLIYDDASSLKFGVIKFLCIEESFPGRESKKARIRRRSRAVCAIKHAVYTNLDKLHHELICMYVLFSPFELSLNVL